MARPAFAGRRARSRSGQLAAFGAVVLVLSAALTILGGAILPVLDAGSRELISQTGATASTVRIQSRLADDAKQQDDTIRATFATALRDRPADLVRTLSLDADVLLDGQPARVQFTADPGLPDAAELTAGSWPAATDEIAVQQDAGLAVGDTVTLGEQVLRVSGTWRALDPSAPRWFSDPAVASGQEDGALGPALVDESVISGLEITPAARWTMIPDPASLGVAGLPEWADAMARLEAEVRRMEGGDAVSLDGTFDDALARATRVTSVAGGVVGLPLVLVTLAGAIVLGLIARALASGRGGEFVLLKARGASPRALAGAAAREALVISLLGAASGAALAVAVLAVAGLAPPVPLLAAIPAGVVVLATALATSVTVTELRAPVTGRAESGRAAVIASLGPLLLVLIAAGLALAQFVSLGSPVVIRPNGLVRTDPVAITAPVLVLLAGALAAPVIAGPLVAIGERFARAGRGILPVLPLRQLARRARSVAAGVLVVALAAGAVVLALAFQLGATASRVHAERASTGADLRISLPVRSSVEDNAPAASSALLDGVVGIDAATAVLATTASVGADPVPVVAGDAEALAGVRSAPAELAPLIPALTARRGGSTIPDGVSELIVRGILSPGGIPGDLAAGVVLWTADRDGSALRVPFGTVPLADGPFEITGPVPADATTVLAVEFRSPALPPFSNVDIDLVGVQSPQGDAIAFDGEKSSVLTSSKNERFLTDPPDTDPLPVVVGAELAERLGIAPGEQFTFRIATVPAPVPATVAGVVRDLPGVADSLGFVLDLPTLETRAVALGGSVPAANQLWATSRHPDAAAAAVRDALTVRAGIVSPRTFSSAPVLDPTVALVVLGVGVTVLLAVLGFAAVAAAIAQQRRAELTPLRSLGLSVSRIRSARVIELVTTAVLAVLLGGAAGLLTALLVVPGLTGVLG